MDDTVNKNEQEVTVVVHVNNGQDDDKQEIHVDNEINENDVKIEMQTERLTIENNENDNKINVEGGPHKRPKAWVCLETKRLQRHLLPLKLR